MKHRFLLFSDEIRVGSFGRIFHPDLMISGMEDSGSNYARARYARGMHVIPLLMDKIRYVAESCDSLQGFMLFSSFGGGTGSGLGALFLSRLEHEFHRRPRIHVGIFPGPELSPVVVEPYNSILFASDVLEQADFSILLDNTALCRVITESVGVDKPNYTHLNRLSAQIISHLTSTLRFPNTLNNSLHEMQVNLIPYPQIKFPASAFSPILCLDRSRHDTMAADALTKSLFLPSNLMVSCDLRKGLFMANSMVYRGVFDPISVNQAISAVKRDTNWVTWCPTGFKIGLSNQKPMFMQSSLLAPSDRSVFMISNTTAIRQVLQKLRRKCCLMYAKQAFVHHYLNEGLEEDELRLAYEEVSKLEGLYREIQALDHDGNFEFEECTSEHYFDPFAQQATSETAQKSTGSAIQKDEVPEEPVPEEVESQVEPLLKTASPEEEEKENRNDMNNEESMEEEPNVINYAKMYDEDNSNVNCITDYEKGDKPVLCKETTIETKKPLMKHRSKFIKKFKINLSKMKSWRRNRK